MHSADPRSRKHRSQISSSRCFRSITPLCSLFSFRPLAFATYLQRTRVACIISMRQEKIRCPVAIYHHRSHRGTKPKTDAIHITTLSRTIQRRRSANPYVIYSTDWFEQPRLGFQFSFNLNLFYFRKQLQCARHNPRYPSLELKGGNTMYQVTSRERR